jgi:hypothetical protein
MTKEIAKHRFWKKLHNFLDLCSHLVVCYYTSEIKDDQMRSVGCSDG